MDMAIEGLNDAQWNALRQLSKGNQWRADLAISDDELLKLELFNYVDTVEHFSNKRLRACIMSKGRKALSAFEAQQHTKAPEGVRCPACEGVGFDPPTMDMCGRCGGTGQIAKRTAQDDFVYGVETPATPAQVDGFLFGDVKRLQAHELHDADGAPVEDKDARIRQLEALVEEAAQVIAPIVEAANDEDLEDYDSYLFAEPHEDYHVFINASDDTYLKMRHLRAIASFATKLDAALKK
jgi:hypothetical protein